MFASKLRGFDSSNGCKSYKIEIMGVAILKKKYQKI
jgi:hypothetical protein